VDRSAVILAEDYSKEFKQDKALLNLRGKPLLKHVIDTADLLVDEIIVVVNTKECAREYAKVLGDDVKFAFNLDKAKSPLVGAAVGLRAAQGTHSALLAADAPFVNSEVLSLFFELCHGKTAVITRWPDEQIEPLHAVYHTKSALEAARIAIDDGKFDLPSMIGNLGGVRYVSTLVVKELDPELKIFFNVNSAVNLKMAETLAKPRNAHLAKRSKPLFKS